MFKLFLNSVSCITSKVWHREEKAKFTEHSEVKKYYRHHQTWAPNWILNENTLNFDSTLGTFINSKKNWNITKYIIYTYIIYNRNFNEEKIQKNLFTSQKSLFLPQETRQHQPTVISLYKWILNLYALTF